MSAASKLKEYESDGYVFHGSPSGTLESIEPRPARDADERNKFKNDLAVFATPSPSASVIFACMHLENVPPEARNESWSVGPKENGESGVEARIPRKWKPYIEDNMGFVYVLPSEQFYGEEPSGHDWQVKTSKSVKPVDVVPAKFSDFEKLGGIIIWVD